MIRIREVLVSAGEGGVYGERMLDGYRVWDPYRSKFAALHMLGKGVDIDGDMKVLYLGAAHGTTVSHVADYVETVYAVEIAPRPMQDLLEVARRRGNVVPLMADATAPETYAPLVEPVDLIYQDVAQPDQASIALKNACFLKDGGLLLMMLKTRSVDVRKTPGAVLEETLGVLSAGYEVLDTCWLDPYHRDHAAVVARVRKEGA